MEEVFGEITFRRVLRSDFALLGRWLAEPHVARWWNHEFTPEAVEEDFGDSADGLEPSEDHLAMLDHEPVGLIQYSTYADYPEYLEELSPIVEVPPTAVSIDYLIGDPDRVGKGLGSRMLWAFVQWIWTVNPITPCIIVPVNEANTASWKVLHSIGFRTVAHGPLEPDNPIDDPLHRILRLDRPTARGDRS